MPTWVLDGPIWERAKATVRERTDYEDLSGGAFYALVSTLYQRMGGRVKRRNARTKALGVGRILLIKSRVCVPVSRAPVRRCVLFFKGGPGSGWFGPPQGTHLPSSAHLANLDEARTWWRTNLGGKTLALTVHSGGKEYPIRVRFDAENDYAYTDSRDASGAKLARRVFGTKRAQAMARIPAVIEHPRLRLRNHGADLLLEGRLHSEHYTVVLTWKEADVYVFDSAHFRSAREVLSLQRHQDHGKNNGPLQKE